MTNRIAPPEGISRHFDAITYLNELSIQWKLRAAGEPHTLTLELIDEWRQHRRGIAECQHQRALSIVDDIVTRLNAEYAWPAPLVSQVTLFDIARIPSAIRELEACKEQVVKY